MFVRLLSSLVAVSLCCLATAKVRADTPSLSRSPVTALAYHPNGKILVAAGPKSVLIFDVATNDLLASLPLQATKVTAIKFSTDGQRLAVAAGEPGQKGELYVYDWPKEATQSALAKLRPKTEPKAHSDVIHDLAWSPDGKLLASCGYDRLIKMWEIKSEGDYQNLVAKDTLRDHSDAVYGVCFSPNGQLLASVAADRAAKVWDVATGKRLYTLSEATDWLYAVAWSPDGQHLAAAGVDRSIRVWSVNPQEGQIIHSVFAHEAPVLRLTYGSDGKTLYSLGEDRVLKSWNAAKMVEQQVYAKQPEVALAFALRSDQKQVALGRFDGVAQLLETGTGKLQSELLPIKPKPPQIAKVEPAAAQRGQTVQVTLTGKYFGDKPEVQLNVPGSSITSVKATDERVQCELSLPGNVATGVYQLTTKTAAGTSNNVPFYVDVAQAVVEKPNNDAATMAEKVSLPATVVGKLDRAGEVDFCRFEATAGAEIGMQVLVAPGAPLDPVLVVTDEQGRTLAEGTAGLLAFKAPKNGTYAVGLRDREYRGESKSDYRLQLGNIPIISAVFPLGLQRGTEVEAHVEGVHLGTSVVKIKAAPDAAIGSRIPVVVQTPHGPALGNKSLVVGEIPEASNFPSPAPALASPMTVNGKLAHGVATDVYRFQARKGERLVLEVRARSLGSAMDPYVEILDQGGKLLPRAALRSLAKTYLTFRDHDGAGSNLRVETWSELNINDYVMMGNELLRIRAMPTHPDADMVFFSVAGQRVGYLDTTPAHAALGTPMYKVEIHPPGTSFPANGYPTFTIPYRNDDGGPGYGKDARLFFDPPVDGEYQVRLGASAAQLGATLAYRLTLRPPQPDFKVSFNPSTPSVWKGNGIPVSVTAERMDGYEGEIKLCLENLPPGLQAPKSSIPAGETTTAFTLFADAGASVPEKSLPLKLVATGNVNGKEIVREAMGSVPKLVDPGDLVATVEQEEIAVKPGGEVKLTMKIERRNGFAGRVPLDVRGLPHGVKVKDIGLNGILITEKESARTFVIYAEPWVQPQEHPIVVLARQEAKNTEHAGKSVLLRIAK